MTGSVFRDFAKLTACENAANAAAAKDTKVLNKMSAEKTSRRMWLRIPVRDMIKVNKNTVREATRQKLSPV
jgi:hypothetical protein